MPFASVVRRILDDDGVLEHSVDCYDVGDIVVTRGRPETPDGCLLMSDVDVRKVNRHVRNLELIELIAIATAAPTLDTLGAPRRDCPIEEDRIGSECLLFYLCRYCGQDLESLRIGCEKRRIGRKRNRVEVTSADPE